MKLPAVVEDPWTDSSLLVSAAGEIALAFSMPTIGFICGDAKLRDEDMVLLKEEKRAGRLPFTPLN